ncbi:MAG TPA: DNA repair protein RecO [Candidatus Saccharimonadales bacterium]|nr:DNA repair protein RecO [Candidatus Saccharimonadales bacterium]
MQYVRAEAIILRRTQYGEADRIVNLLTLQQGRVAAIAKGVRRPKSKLAGGLELFAVCDVTLAEGRGELFLVTSARLVEFFGGILQDYDRLQLGYQVIKQITQATQTVSEPEFYTLLKSTLGYLNKPGIDWHLTEVWFELQLSQLLGEGLNVQTDAEGDLLNETGRYGFDFVGKTFFKDKNGQFSGDHIKLLRLALKTTPAVMSRVASATVDPARDLHIFVSANGV